MSLTAAQARDEMSTRFYDDWRAKAPLAWNGGVPHVVWEGAQEADKKGPRTDRPWARVTVAHNVAPQRTFGEPGNRRFERLGLITVQLFVPLGMEDTVALAEALGTIARDAFEGRTTPGGVWFRNARLQEVGPDGPWWQLNIVTDFSYEELK